ncbi:potassium channel subfamily K member 18-like, partial [Tropilaelaps mercedesae]
MGSLALAQNTLTRINSQKNCSNYRMVHQSPQLAKHNLSLNHCSLEKKGGGSERQQNQTEQILTDLNQEPSDAMAAQHFNMTLDELSENNQQRSRGNLSGGPVLSPIDGTSPKFEGGSDGQYTSCEYKNVPPSYPIGVPLGLTDFEESRKCEEECIRVPVSLCVLIMVAYISGGAVLFSLWEDWGFLEGAYFCFVTLSTI